MFIKAGIAALMLIMTTVSGGTKTVSNMNVLSQSKGTFLKSYGDALPPVGFVDYCGRNPEDCTSGKNIVNRIDLTPERWSLLAQVNSYVNQKISPVSDQELYGRTEFWTIPTDAGDCEDYLLLKRKYLLDLGFSESALLITVVLDEKNEGHAVLTVSSRQGDFVLDNRREEILRWTDTNYVFLKRQSQKDQRKWVALVRNPTNAGTFGTGGPQNDK